VAATSSVKKPKAQATQGGDERVEGATKTFVIDTSVLIADPRAIFRFGEHEIVIPIIVINELEK